MVNDANREAGAAHKPSAAKRRKKRELRVGLETSVLFNGSASDLLQQETANLIHQSVYDDLEVLWYLPEIVRHERQYQMQRRALELLPSLIKVETLLGFKLNINEEVLFERVERA